MFEIIIDRIKRFSGRRARSSMLPIGSIFPFADIKGDVFYKVMTDEGFIDADGSSLSKETYPRLYDVLGTFYGGTTTSFKIPDFRGKTLRGITTI